MNEAVRNQYEAFPDPSPDDVPIGPGQLDRVDDSLHFGWSWHRHRHCYRASEGLRILDAGCGTGLSTLGLARLNPGSEVLGVDFSPRSLDLAGRRLEASGLSGVTFREHDLDQPIPSDWGPFDFIACRRVLGQSADPAAILQRLARALDRRGLLLATFPSRLMRQPAAAMRQAVDALAAPQADLKQRAELGLELFRALRPDGPIRRFDVAHHGPTPPSVARFVQTYLGAPTRDWSLAEAAAALERAGLQWLEAPTRAPWSVDQAVVVDQVGPALRDRISALEPAAMALLTDALNPSLHGDEYRLYACQAAFEPRVPAWPERRHESPEVFDALIPHLTGLVVPAGPAVPDTTAVYRTSSGALGELDPASDFLLRRVDGKRSCGELDGLLAERAGHAQETTVRQQKWLDLANLGFILLESPDRRQHVDCRHLGAILDRLDCACPRRWVRACDLHGYCTISAVGPGDEREASLAAARRRLGISRTIACETCEDYTPDQD